MEKLLDEFKTKLAMKQFRNEKMKQLQLHFLKDFQLRHIDETVKAFHTVSAYQSRQVKMTQQENLRAIVDVILKKNNYEIDWSEITDMEVGEIFNYLIKASMLFFL